MGWSEGRDHRTAGLGGRRGRQGAVRPLLGEEADLLLPLLKRPRTPASPFQALGKSFVSGKEHDVRKAVAISLANLESSLADGSGVEPDA